MFLTFEGITADNEYRTISSHIELSHPSTLNKLIFAEFDSKPYENYRSGQTRSDGRSLLGAIRLKGDKWKKEVWECNFFAKLPQVELFEMLLQSQEDTAFPVTLVDRWTDDENGITKDVWIDIDRQYLTLIAANQWFRLQFQLLEV